jgi:8-oxo-dGTP diphosphatase
VTTHRTDGDGWVDCACGQRHWGIHGAAGLMLLAGGRDVLLQHRDERSHQGGTWALPGGARTSTELPQETALREAAEEAGVDGSDVALSATSRDDHHTWSYTTVIGHVPEPIAASPTSWETKELRWVDIDLVTELPLHPAFAEAWTTLRELAQRRLTVVVDAANVVGSRPDGWWRDRLGANRRLRDQLADLARAGLPASALELPGATWWPSLHLVVEGKARGLEAIPDVAVHAAPNDGDSTIAEIVAETAVDRPDDYLVAVTADRELRDRVHAAGGRTVGPGTLTRLLSPTPE